jgi:hypothetical protein
MNIHQVVSFQIGGPIPILTSFGIFSATGRLPDVADLFSLNLRKPGIVEQTAHSLGFLCIINHLHN